MDPEESEIQRLIQRIYNLELQVAAIREQMGESAPKGSGLPAVAGDERRGRSVAFSAVQPQTPPTTPASKPPEPAVPRAGLEESVVGTWFPRVGAIAILLGAGFGFKYAIERGFIGPEERVAVGLAAGIAFIGWGGWARRRGWDRFAQATTAGGVALMYLSVLAAYLLYRLIGPSTAFAFLSLIAAAAAVLAVSYDSLALAALATVGGFINPFLVFQGRGDPSSLYAYVALLDAVVVLLAFLKRWKALDFIAFAGTWIVFAATAEGAGRLEAFTFASIFFLLFAAIPYLRAVLTRNESAGGSDEDVPTDPEAFGARALEVTASVIGLSIPNALFYAVAGLSLLTGDLDRWQGPFIFALATAHLAAGLAGRGSSSTPSGTYYGMAIALFTTWLPVQFDGLVIVTGWALKGTLLVWLGLRIRSNQIKAAGVAVSALAFVAALAMFARSYDPGRLFVSLDSLNLVIQIAAIYLTSYLFFASKQEPERPAAIGMAVAGNVLTLVWLTVEAAIYLEGSAGGGQQTFQFTASAVWAVYAAGLLAAGVALRTKWARLLSVALFAVTILKMTLVDLWLLKTGYRVLAFIGLGALLLLCSLMYYRFRELILGGQPDGSTSLSDRPAGAQ